ncbi:hypothetical protein CYMTET_53151 [Cymbomonas tetramitiformis]|uniref:Uncharacterized protein n=1 Tax=Cymbomonas tetramitiformis TaxID=36881 RepID=A0AAE0BHH6_9CHLO|nr:hypothetical protein CYMTET_53151 [Cymbomonas tetramitiformis]
MISTDVARLQKPLHAGGLVDEAGKGLREAAQSSTGALVGVSVVMAMVTVSVTTPDDVTLPYVSYDASVNTLSTEVVSVSAKPAAEVEAEGGNCTAEATETLPLLIPVMSTSGEVTPAESAIWALKVALKDAAKESLEKLLMSRALKLTVEATLITSVVVAALGARVKGRGNLGLKWLNAGRGQGWAPEVGAGMMVGVGILVGGAVGYFVGLEVVGNAVGARVGAEVGAAVGMMVGGAAGEAGGGNVGEYTGVAVVGIVVVKTIVGDVVGDAVVGDLVALMPEGCREVGDPVVGLPMMGYSGGAACDRSTVAGLLEVGCSGGLLVMGWWGCLLDGRVAVAGLLVMGCSGGLLVIGGAVVGLLVMGGCSGGLPVMGSAVAGLLVMGVVGLLVEKSSAMWLV